MNFSSNQWESARSPIAKLNRKWSIRFSIVSFNHNSDQRIKSRKFSFFLYRILYTFRVAAPKVCALYIVFDDAVKADDDNCIWRNKKEKRNKVASDVVRLSSLFSYIVIYRFPAGDLSHKIGIVVYVCVCVRAFSIWRCIDVSYFLLLFFIFQFLFLERILLLAKRNVCFVEELLDNWTQGNREIKHSGFECVENRNRFWQLFESRMKFVQCGRQMQMDAFSSHSFWHWKSYTFQWTHTYSLLNHMNCHTSTRTPIKGFYGVVLPLAKTIRAGWFGNAREFEHLSSSGAKGQVYWNERESGREKGKYQVL